MAGFVNSNGVVFGETFCGENGPIDPMVGLKQPEFVFFECQT